jgi:2-phosphosulfolactate phosphatase
MAGSFSIKDLVTEHQKNSGRSLRNLVNRIDIDFDIVELETQPLELGDNLVLWELKEDLPERLPDAQYVIIDTVFFTSTTLAGLESGVEAVKVESSHEAARSNNGIPVGGESNREYGPREGFDFFNSPTSIRRNTGDAERVALTSDNGAVAAVNVAEAAPETADIFLGTTLNAEAVGNKLRESDKPVHIVSAGSRGSHTAEDHIAAFLIGRYYRDEPLTEEENELVQVLLAEQENVLYPGETPDIRKKDLEAVSSVNSVEQVPRLHRVEDGWEFR